MPRETVSSPDLPRSPNYSPAIKVGNLVFVSGTVAYDPRTKKVEATSIEAQTDRAIENCATLLRAAGADLPDVVQVTVLLHDPADFERMNSAYAKHFPRDPPTRMVAKLGVDLPNIRISVAMTAVVQTESTRNSG